MKKAEITIIVPVYNAAEHLRRCVDSLFAQTLKNFELILVDDGSSDESPAICDCYTADPRVKVIHKENGGPCTARNCGMDAAQGEFIGFVDADDWCEPDMFEKLYNIATEDEADMAFCDYIIENESGGRPVAADLNGDYFYDTVSIKQAILPYFFGYNSSELKNYKSYCPFADYSSYIWLCIFKTSVIRENELYFPSQNEYYNEDNLFNLNFVTHSKRIVHIAKPFYHYRDCESSLTKRYNAEFLNAKLNKFEYLKDYIDKHGLEKSFYSRLQNKICIESINIINYYVNSNITAGEKYAKIREILSSPAVSSALKQIDLSNVSLFSMLGIFLRCEKIKVVPIILLLCESYKLIRK